MKKCNCCCNETFNLGCFNICNLPEALEVDCILEESQQYDLYLCWAKNKRLIKTVTGTGAKLILNLKEDFKSCANTSWCYTLQVINKATKEKKCFGWNYYRDCP